MAEKTFKISLEELGLKSPDEARDFVEKLHKIANYVFFMTDFDTQFFIVSPVPELPLFKNQIDDMMDSKLIILEEKLAKKQKEQEEKQKVFNDAIGQVLPLIKKVMKTPAISLTTEEKIERVPQENIEQKQQEEQKTVISEILPPPPPLQEDVIPPHEQSQISMLSRPEEQNKVLDGTLTLRDVSDVQKPFLDTTKMLEKNYYCPKCEEEVTVPVPSNFKEVTEVTCPICKNTIFVSQKKKRNKKLLAIPIVVAIITIALVAYKIFGG